MTAHGDDLAWSMLDAAPDAALMVTESGDIAYVNDIAGRLFGYPPDDLLGRSVDDLLPTTQATVHRAHRARYCADPVARPMGAGLALSGRRSDGSHFPIEVTLSPLQLGGVVFVAAFVRDIGARVAVEDQLHRVLRTLDASDDGVFIFDATTLHFSYVNAGAVRLAGYAHDELLTMTPLHLEPSASKSEYRAIIEQLRSPDATSVTRRSTLCRQDGSEVAVERTHSLAPTGRDGTSWMITVVRDITGPLAAESDLRKSQGALRATEQFLAVAEDRERIARDLHDTVIQRLFGEGLNLQSALVGLDGPSVGRVQSTIDGLDETIKQLRLAIFSLSGDDSAPGGLRARLLAVVTDATAGLGFDPHVEFDGPVETMADVIADHLVPVLREALSNITKHAGADSVRISIRLADDVTLTVTDDGRGPAGAAATDGGRGLGNLAERAEELDGVFTMAPRPGGGTIVTWRVPATA
ncbi:MAG: PAS domain S-box protein [Ilumatobacteraceae bacterium]